MEMRTKKRVTDESWDYTLTVKVGHDHFGRPLLSLVRQMRDMLSSWLDNNSMNN